MSRVYSYAIFVDLPNFYSGLLRSNLAEPRSLRDYFLYWLDFDRLSSNLASVISPTWVFYSGRRFGPSNNRIENDFLNDYIQRINSSRGVTARDVNIPGSQREPVSYRCENCGEEGIAQWESEKGIDASLTVHLFDTCDAWDIAFLLSGDADFVPVVQSLRRRGKIIVGVGFSGASSALVRECYDYKDLSESFLADDVFAYLLFKHEGIVYKWFTEPIVSDRERVTISVAWRLNVDQSQSIIEGEEYCSIVLQTNGTLDLTSRIELLEELRENFPNNFKENSMQANGLRYEFRIHPLAWEGIRRRLDILRSIANLEGPIAYTGDYLAYAVKYQRNETGELEAVV